MYWLFLLLSLGAMTVALRTTSMLLMVLALLAALGLLLAWAMGWYSARTGGADQQGRGMVDPVELHRLRQQAEARRAAQQGTSAAGEPGDGA